MIGNELSHPQDSPILIRGRDADLFSVVDQVVQNAVQEGDLYIALNAAATLRKWGQVTGLALAKLLYKLKVRWSEFFTDDDFVDAAASTVGISVQTVRKYTDIWEFVILGSPTDLMDKFMGMPVETLWLIAPASKSGDLDEDHWSALAKSENKNDVRDKIRSIRGIVTSASSALVIMLNREGFLMAKRGEDEPREFGYFDLKTEDVAAGQAIERICNAAGVIRL
jgi:hypothetical protein